MTTPQAWTMELSFSGGTFENLKEIAEHILGRVTKAATYKELPIMGSGSGGGDSWHYFSVKYTCPLEHKIADLRAEADRLEQTLGPKP